jgi:hypothetical protein
MRLSRKLIVCNIMAAGLVAGIALYCFAQEPASA